MPENSKPSLPRLILVPAVITLAVTLLRLMGELQRWSPRLFNRDPGGGAALVGIVWLIPVFGAYFALKLARQGEGPATVGKAAGWAALAFVGNIAVSVAFFWFVKGPVAQIAILTVTSVLAILVARPGWPALWRVLLAYGFAARVPVAIVMFLSIFGGWDTHYTKPRPDFPAMGPWGLFFWTGVLPQLSLWIWLTVAFGGLFGALALGIRRLVNRPAAAPARAQETGS